MATIAERSATPSPAMQLTLQQRRTATQHLLGQAATQPSLHLRWPLLCAAHIAGQSVLGLHLQTHWAMLGTAWQQRDMRETLGQLARLALVPLGHALGRLPLGNTGRADTSAFAPMPVPAPLRQLIEQALVPGTVSNQE